LHGQILAVNGGSSVYGGSQPLPPATLPTQPLDTPLQLEVCGGDGAAWQGVAPTAAAQPHYAACLDLSALQGEPAGVLQAVHAAAARFAGRYTQQASLTLLLPAARPRRWQDAGDGAAARMLVATLACEWGSRALRINALEVPAGVEPRSLHPLLRYVCGSGAQYLTGQTLCCSATPGTRQ
jgi:hypothetical protein